MYYLFRLLMSNSFFLASPCNNEVYQTITWTRKRAILRFKEIGFVQINERIFKSEANDLYKLYSRFDGFLELLQDMPKEGYNKNMTAKFI